MIIRSKVIRGLLGIAVIGLILVMLNGWWSEYRVAAKSAGSVSATSSPLPATAVTPVKATVLIDGLNLRQSPQVTAVSIRGLKKGQTVVVLNTSGSWMQVRDADGTTGWVTDNPQYIKVLK